MMKLSENQLSKLLLHATGINNVLEEALLSFLQPETGKPEGADTTETDVNFKYPFEDFDIANLNKPERPQEPQFSIEEYYDSNSRQREQALSRLCGRWMAGRNRCGVEISRAGEHFILTYLKRNGRPSEQRYILIWLDGDILYYGYEDRMTILALNTENDTLMISPGADYTRVSKDERK